MTISDLWQMVCTGWYLMLIGLLATLIPAGTFLAITPDRYEATILVEIGRASTIRFTNIVTLNIIEELIEPTENTKFRMEGNDFKIALTKSLGWAEVERGRLLINSFKVTVLKEGFLQIKLHGYSQEDARRAAETSGVMLEDIHNAMGEVRNTLKEHYHATVVTDIADAEAFLRLVKPLVKKSRPQDRSWANEWLLAVKDEMDVQSQLRALRLKEAVLKEAMKPEHNVPTRSLRPVNVSSRPVHPNARLVWLSTIIGGLLIGLLLVVLRSIVHSSKSPNPT